MLPLLHLPSPCFSLHRLLYVSNYLLLSSSLTLCLCSHLLLPLCPLLFLFSIWLSTLLLSSTPFAFFLCCFTSLLPVVHPLLLFLWPCSPVLFMLFVFFCLAFITLSSSYISILVFLHYLHASSLFHLNLCLLSLPPFTLAHFLPSSSFFHSLSFCHPTPLAACSGQCAQSILAQAGGQWVSPWLHTRTHRHMHLCMHTQTCWRWWLMSNAKLSASMPIRAAQETSLGLLATAWHWLQYLPACLLHSGRTLKSWGYTFLSTDNHKKWLRITDQTPVQ